jgi:hypothetical protein
MRGADAGRAEACPDALEEIGMDQASPDAVDEGAELSLKGPTTSPEQMVATSTH